MYGCKQVESFLNKMQDFSLLIVRLILAYGFYGPAMNKWSDMGAVAQWFGEDLGLPFPLINAYMAASTEMAGVVLLSVGFGVRYISLPMMVVMVVAITTVHLPNGFSSADNGFEIPLYYLIMLFVLVSHGGGKWGVDGLISTRNR